MVPVRLNPLSLILSVALAGITRSKFLVALLECQSFILLPPSLTARVADEVEIALRWLPTAGCLAAPFVIEEQYRYWAVLDTGSPFLTAPPQVASFTRAQSRRYPPTKEQYGETVANVSWRKSRQVLVNGVLQIHSCLIGVVPDELVQETGGIFCGLVYEDDFRPTFLQQAKVSSFKVDYASRALTLYKTPQLQTHDSSVLKMFDLASYGPDLHHYAVLADDVVLITNQGEFRIQGSTRPIVVVIDTGLTGCIFSDSLEKCLPVPLSSIQGARMRIGPSTTLKSDTSYWNLACFRLPWFSNDRHPHIIAAGATFLIGSAITIDAKQHLLRVDNLQS